MKQCPNCGKELKDEKFCPECGRPVSESDCVQAVNTDNSAENSNAKANTSSAKPKNNSKLSTILIIVGALLVAAVFLVYNFTKDNNKKSASGTSYMPSTSSSSIYPSAETKPTESDPVKEYYSVGESCTLEGITATIDSCEIFNYDGFIKPKDDCVFIKVHVKVENNSNKDETLGSVNFDCYADNQIVDNRFLSVDGYLSYDTIAPGRYISGDLYYEVPKNSDVELEFTPEWILSKHKAIFKLEY